VIPVVNLSRLIDVPFDFGETESPPRSAQTATNGHDSGIAFNQPGAGDSLPVFEPIKHVATDALDDRASRMNYDDGLNPAQVEHTAGPQLESPS
jgi:hypothetical protein